MSSHTPATTIAKQKVETAITSQQANWQEENGNMALVLKPARGINKNAWSDAVRAVLEQRGISKTATFQNNVLHVPMEYYQHTILAEQNQSRSACC